MLMEVYVVPAESEVVNSWEIEIADLQALDAVLVEYSNKYPDAMVSYTCGEICIDKRVNLLMKVY